MAKRLSRQPLGGQKNKMQENKLKYEAIIFDFDYTLADSSKGVIKCVNDSLSDLNYPLASPENICRTIGMPLSSVFEILSGQTDPSQIQKLMQLFKGYADEVMADLTVLYPFVNPIMQQIINQDRKLGIVSTKYRYRIESILRRENAFNWSDVIVGGEDVTKYKPDPEGLCQAIRSINCAID